MTKEHMESQIVPAMQNQNSLKIVSCRHWLNVYRGAQKLCLRDAAASVTRTSRKQCQKSLSDTRILSPGKIRTGTSSVTVCWAWVPACCT